MCLTPLQFYFSECENQYEGLPRTAKGGRGWSCVSHFDDNFRINRSSIVQYGGPGTITPALFGTDAFSNDKVATRGDQNR